MCPDWRSVFYTTSGCWSHDWWYPPLFAEWSCRLYVDYTRLEATNIHYLSHSFTVTGISLTTSGNHIDNRITTRVSIDIANLLTSGECHIMKANSSLTGKGSIQKCNLNRKVSKFSKIDGRFFPVIMLTWITTCSSSESLSSYLKSTTKFELVFIAAHSISLGKLKWKFPK